MLLSADKVRVVQLVPTSLDSRVISETGEPIVLV